MIKKIFASILKQQINLQEGIFYLSTAAGAAALLILLLVKFFMGERSIFLLVLLLYVAVILAILTICLRCHKSKTGAVCISSVTIFFILPCIFFTGGGIYGGVPLWFVFFFVYVCLVLPGWEGVVFQLFSWGITIGCYYLAYHNPDYVMQQPKPMVFADSAASVILVGVLIGIMIFFQRQIYAAENRTAQKQREEIESLNQAQNRFFSSMSHEIRTPINTIIGLNEMILRGDISEEIAEDARSIQGASKMLLTLINDILDLSKIESGKMDIIPVSYETGVFFSDIVNMIWIRAKEKGLEFHLDIAPSMPSMLCGDEVRIKQVLINILNNSVKYTKEGSITLTVGCRRLGPNRVMVSYEVTDTGQGIRKENIPHLFEAFQRVDEKENRYIEGTGLGLSIVKQLVELMGGEIHVNSVYTKGSTFLITLEQEIMDEKELGDFNLEHKIRQGIREQYKQSFEAPSARILIVDDNEMNLMVAKKLLTDTKIQIDTAQSGEDCLKLSQNIRYDGILMDHLMPGMDGIECLHAMRAQAGGACRKTPVIALTANAGGDMQLLYKKEGFSGYLAKPVSGALLEAAVLKILPAEKVIFSDNALGQESDGDILLRGRKQKVPLLVTTDSVSDIPKELAEQLKISILPYYIQTSEGCFLDGEELESDELLVYLSYEGKKAHSIAPDVSDYEQFFAQKLSEAHNVIHIAMAKSASEGYHNASAAAQSFENVTVIDSGHLSCGLGIFTLYAAQMALRDASRNEILQELSKLKNRISTTFILDKTKTLCDVGKLPRFVQAICDAMMLHPVIKLKKSAMTVGMIRVGGQEHVIKSYVGRMLRNGKNIDKSILFIAYAGVEEEVLEMIQEQVKKRCVFERVYLQKASPTISSNCGAGTFGLIFMKKEASGSTSRMPEIKTK